jgi:hypothetical protein
MGKIGKKSYSFNRTEKTSHPDNNSQARKLGRRANAIEWSRFPADYLKVYVDETAWSLDTLNNYKWV